MMQEFHELNDSIACSKCEIIARKLVPSIPINDPEYGKGIKYTLSRNASAKVLEELFPKEFKKNPSSNLNLNDIIKADGISAFVGSIKRFKPDIINKSHTHKASLIVMNAFCYAYIKYPLENVVKSIQSRRLIENK